MHSREGSGSSSSALRVTPLHIVRLFAVERVHKVSEERKALLLGRLRNDPFGCEEVE